MASSCGCSVRCSSPSPPCCRRSSSSGSAGGTSPRPASTRSLQARPVTSSEGPGFRRAAPGDRRRINSGYRMAITYRTGDAPGHRFEKLLLVTGRFPTRVRNGTDGAREIKVADRFDFELRAIEADVYAETVCQFSGAESWRDIARGYRMLSDFLVHEQAAQRYQEPATSGPKNTARIVTTSDRTESLASPLAGQVAPTAPLPCSMPSLTPRAALNRAKARSNGLFGSGVGASSRNRTS